ncbi:MAG TPA: PAS domain S-box protein [Candidatus Tectomicrobia bacterium]
MTTKVVLAATSLVCIGVLGMFGVYLAFTTVRETLYRVTEVAEPLSVAAYEMEISVIGTGLAVMSYLETGMPQHRTHIEKKTTDFTRYKTQYDRLATTPAAKELGNLIGLLYQEFSALSAGLMSTRPRQELLTVEITSHLQAMDAIFGTHLKSPLNHETPQGIAKLTQAVQMETDMAAVGTWLRHYLRTADPASRQRLFDGIRSFAEELAQFRRLALTDAEQHWANELEHHFDQAARLIQEALTQSDSLDAQVERFLQVRTTLRNTLGDGVQVLTQQGLAAAKAATQQAVRTVPMVLVGCLLLSLGIGAGVLVFLNRHMLQPLAWLSEGVGRVGRGELDYRVEVTAHDEIGTLAAAFNNMVVQRQQAEVALQHANAELEARVAARTAALVQANEHLQRELRERQRVEETLQASEARYRDLFENANDLVYIHDLTGNVLFVNRAAERLSGYTRDDALRLNLTTLVAPEDRQRFQEILAHPPAGLAAETYDLDIITREGRRVSLNVSARLIAQNGTPVAVQCIARDITERKRLEAHLYEAKRLEALGTLAGGIAHDFNNILTAILGYTDLVLITMPPDHPQRRFLQAVLTAGNRAKELVQQILTFSRQQPQQRRPLLLPPLLEEAVALLRASLPATITIRQRVAADVGPVLADSSQMLQVVLNLGTNAAHAMRETGGEFEIGLQPVELDTVRVAHYPDLRPGPHVCLTVRDTGHGMPPEVMARVFEPFFTTKSPGEGSGLGLAVVHGIVTNHGGAITVDSTPGQGTTFAVYLPCTEQTPHSTTTPAEPIPGGQERILFVEDEAPLAELGRVMLTHLGYDVVACKSSREALDIFRAAPQYFDLVITDQTMPELTGEALARELRRLRPELPIILCTGFSQTLTQERAADLGINAFLMKPVETSDLGLTIRRVLGAARPYS